MASELQSTSVHMHPIESGAHHRVTRRASDVFEQAINLPGWQQDYWQRGVGSFEGATESLCLDEMHLFRESMNRSVDQIGEAPRGRLVLGIPNLITGEGYWAGRPIHGQALLTLQSGDELTFRTSESSDISFITIDLQTLERYAKDVEGVDISKRLTGLPRAQSIHPEIADNFRFLLRQAMENVLQPGDEHASRHLRHCLLGGCLDVMDLIPNGNETTGAQRVHRYMVDAVREIVLARPSQPPTVDEMASTLKVSRRTLHHAFTQVLGVNPVTYIRTVRLHQARRALRGSIGSPGRVRDIAVDCGFWHLGQFAQDYKTLFGESPSKTRPWLN
jgi:AraC family transcriptional regulator, ethanolamine operon transcriptional activator